MEYILSESLKRNKNSTAKVIAVVFLYIIGLNQMITLTNNLAMYRNTVCILLLLITLILMYFIFKRIIFVYDYNLSEDSIEFTKLNGRHRKAILAVNFNNIKLIDKYENIYPSIKVQKTYYFIYGFNYNNCYFTEYETNNKIYRFVFKPSERLLRILERKIGNKNYEHGKHWINWGDQKV